MRISDWSSDVCSSDLGQKGVTAAERRPVQALEQPLFAAKDQILGFDLNDVPTRVAADHLGANDADAAAPAILAQRDPGALGKAVPIGLTMGILRGADRKSVV